MTWQPSEGLRGLQAVRAWRRLRSRQQGWGELGVIHIPSPSVRSLPSPLLSALSAARLQPNPSPWLPPLGAAPPAGKQPWVRTHICVSGAKSFLVRETAFGWCIWLANCFNQLQRFQSVLELSVQTYSVARFSDPALPTTRMYKQVLL